ncbi:MAG: ABC transporter permease [Oscillospiraceae bacterium]|nr:ABC transporter permease [Oscillospiraceae bacterium]
MAKYIIKRLLMIIPILAGVVVVVFTINYFSSGSPAFVYLGASATTESIAELEHEWGLDRPYIIQLLDYFRQIIFEQSLGTSYVYKVPVTELIMEKLGPTLVIGLSGSLISVVIGLILGVVAATHQYSGFDYGATFFAVLLNALPNFWVAMMLMYLFGLKLNLLPISGLGSPSHYIMPVIAVSLSPVAVITRMTRSSMLEVIRQDYIRTARGKGISERDVIFKHALKNALIPVVTVIGLIMGVSVTGTIIIETVFNIPGLGLLIKNSIASNDYSTIQGCILVCALIISLLTLLTDIIYAVIDPRIKAQYEGQSRKKRPQLQKGGAK